MDKKIKAIVLTATFAALAIILGAIEIPWPPAPFLKLDFSEVVILVSLMTLGVSKTSVVVILRTLIRILIKGDVDVFPFLGEYVAIISSFSIIFFYYLSSKLTKTNLTPLIKREFCDISKISIIKPVINSIIVTLGFTFVMVSLNFFVTVPIQFTGGTRFFVTQFIKDLEAFGNPMGIEGLGAYSVFIFSFILPFNLVKGLLVMFVFEILNTRLKYLEV